MRRLDDLNFDTTVRCGLNLRVSNSQSKDSLSMDRTFQLGDESMKIVDALMTFGSPQIPVLSSRRARATCPRVEVDRAHDVPIRGDAHSFGVGQVAAFDGFVDQSLAGITEAPTLFARAAPAGQKARGL